MRILVTGHRGYIGRHLLPMLSGAGHTVDGCDLADGADIREGGYALPPGPHDAVVHLAALASASESWKRPLWYYATNVGGTAAMLGSLACRNFSGRLVFASSVLAAHPEANAYAASKAAGERLLADAARAHGFSAISLRLANVAGGDDRTPGRLIPTACLAARTGETVQLYGNCLRDYVHVADVCQGILLALGRPLDRRMAERFDIGMGIASSNTAVLRAVELTSWRVVQRSQQPRRPCDPERVLADPERLLPGWQPERGLQHCAADAWEACLRRAPLPG